MSAIAPRRVRAVTFFPSKVFKIQTSGSGQGGCVSVCVGPSRGVRREGGVVPEPRRPTRRRTMFKRSIALAACALCLCAAAFAQTVTGTLQGTVKDPNGAVVPGATVAIRNVETGQERT